MNIPETRKYSKLRQYLISLALVLAISVVCKYTSNYIGYRVVALVLLMTTSIIAMLFDILPVMLAALISAFIWNFFFIPPLYTFHIDHTEDVLMFLLYFVIALVNAVLTFKIREAETKARDKEEKENTIKLYNTLLNSLSHELRTPISAILGAVDTLKDNPGLSIENQNTLLSEIDKAGIRLNRQVENLLNMSRLESGMLQPKPDWCDINELVHGVIRKLTPDYPQKILFIQNEKLPLFKLDAGLLEQVVHNLLHNAIQYTPVFAVVEVAVSYENNSCRIAITDSGSGFPVSAMPFVFEKFYRLPNSKTGGNGLGLSIVKGFVEAMNGWVKLENVENSGARFIIEIPAKTSFLSNLHHE